MLFVLSGPESCGKTTLTNQLGTHFEADIVTEAARHYLNKFNPTALPRYLPSDLLNIARLQHHSEKQLPPGNLAFADTDVQVIRIWWHYKYGCLPTTLQTISQNVSPRHYLICKPDIAWIGDPMRENESDRDHIFALYVADAKSRGLSWSVVSGGGNLRFEQALQQIDSVRKGGQTPEE